MTMKNRKGFLSKIIVLCLLLTIIASVAACTQVVEFKVNFIVDGEIYKTVNTAGEEAISLPADPTKNGYIFDGWYWDEDVWSRPFTAESLLTEKLTADMSVYAKWINEDITKRYYTVTFNSFGGGEVESASVLYGKTFAEPTKPTKAGYVLVGWYKEADLTTKWNFATDVVTEDITLYAKWVDESDATGSDIIAAEGFGINGNVLSIKTPNSQEYFALSNAITVSPYATWTVTTDIAGKEEIPSGTVALEVGDNTYYINVTSGNGSNKKQYTVNIRRREIYTLTYVFNNGDENAVMQIEEDGKPENKQVEKTGYTFVEWKNGEKAWDFENNAISGNTTLEAVWSANEYDVTFDPAGGNAIDPVKATYDSAYSWEVPEKTGYTFIGWKADEVMLTDENGDSLFVWNITETTEVVAVWEIVNYTVTYDNLKGADNPNVSTYTVEDEVIFATISQDGYTFIEWQDEDGNAIEGIENGSTGNRTIKAVWDLIPYTVTFVIDGEEVASETFNVETQSVTEPEIPEKTGYTHAWEDYDFIAQNITVNAVYTPIVYNVTYIVEGEYDVDVPVNDNPVTYTIEDETVILQAPSKTGYNFVKWTENGEEVTEIAAGSYGNKTITAQWEAIVYNIEYKDAPINTNVTSYTVETLGGADGSITLAEPTKTEILSYESNLDGSVEVKREAYTFLGWYSDENYENKVTSITLGLTTLYAKWSLTTTTTTEPYVRDGDTVYFGSYPQTRVTDTATTSALGGFDSSTWTSYGYYAGGSVSDYMYYIDKEYNGERYRGVYFTSYRPYSCSSSSSARYSYQDDNGYSTSTVYWFKYEPIAWTVVNEEGGKATLVADLILDSQQYDYENGSYSNNYAESTIRAWLNDTFYNTAFNDLQKAIIQTTEVDNSATSTGYSSNPYACENTYDRIFLMSYVEASTWFTSAAARQRQGSDYAKCQGLYVSTSSSYAGNSCLWLRSPNYDSYSARYVNYYGYFDYNYVYDTNGGVLPALVIEL